MPAASKPSLVTLNDFFRFAVRRFKAARLAYGHGTTNAVDEAAFMMLEALRLPIHTLDPWLDLDPGDLLELGRGEPLRLVGVLPPGAGLAIPAADIDHLDRRRRLRRADGRRRSKAREKEGAAIHVG